MATTASTTGPDQFGGTTDPCTWCGIGTDPEIGMVYHATVVARAMARYGITTTGALHFDCLVTYAGHQGVQLGHVTRAMREYGMAQVLGSCPTCGHGPNYTPPLLHGNPIDHRCYDCSADLWAANPTHAANCELANLGGA